MSSTGPPIGPPPLALWRRFFKGRKGRLRLAAVTGVGALAVLGSFALLNTSGAGAVTVRGVHFHLIEGSTELGLPWVSPIFENETTGFPIAVSIGTTFSVSLLVINEDNVNHTLVRADAGGAFSVSGVQPKLPIGVEGRDDGTLSFVLQVPSTSLSSAIAYVNITVD